MTVRRVLLTADTLGGVWGFAFELARGLSDQGVGVVLATLGGKLDAPRRRAAQAIPGLVLRESSYRLEWMDRPWADVARSGRWLRALAHAFRPDVVHLNQFAFGTLGWPTPALVTAHSCVYSWFAAVHGAEPGLEQHAYWRAVARGLASADAVAAPSRAMARAVKRHYGPGLDVRVVYNGRRAGDFWPGRKRDRILAAGRLWDSAKNLNVLARIAPALDWPVRLVGPDRGPDGTHLDTAAVEHVGPLRSAALAEEFASAAIYALPARYEPFGLGVLEAALAGCALVLGDIPSLREIWGDAACYVPPNDATALAGTLRRLIRNPEQRRAQARRARCQALRYTATAMTQRYLAFYHGLAEEATKKQTTIPIYRSNSSLHLIKKSANARK